MIDQKKERRRFHRLFFTMEDGIIATFAFSDLQKGLLTAHIINLSEGGLGLALSKHEEQRIWKGDYLVLSHVKGIKGLESLINVKVQVKWILEDQLLEFIGCGCQFLDVPQSTQEKIRMIINAWHRRKIAVPS
jgi:c-di-GMP-binding flagellar brake protein YcgR